MSLSTQVHWELIWEFINEKDGFRRAQARARIYGGWLVSDIFNEISNPKRVLSNALTFVPDAEHKWEVEFYER
jgi:hypothetical protein